jgi:hypothetical protein
VRRACEWWDRLTEHDIEQIAAQHDPDEVGQCLASYQITGSAVAAAHADTSSSCAVMD